MKTTPPGLVSAASRPDVIAMLCTAGHVDHGKTSLVKALTGCMTDRLKEEIERGLTIELGFAPCWIGGDLCAGIVDVPGHERFVRTMVSGVSGIDFCVLVIAADDGIMPQTREHVEIMQLMGMKSGMVALTKSDLVPPERIASRTEEIRAFLAPTFLRDAPICPVSTVTGEGYGEFYDTLVASVKSALVARRAGVFRMPVERAFSRPGFGAVVTGIPVAGRVAVGAEIECVPGGARGHLRGLQCFGHAAEEGGAGQCLALNIPEFGKIPPPRGSVLCEPGFLKAGRQFHARLQAVSRMDPPLKNAEEISFHTGTAEGHGRIYLLEEKHLESGATMPVTVLVSEPLAAAEGDRFIVRRVSPPMTVGGGRILKMDATDRRPRRKAIWTELAALELAWGESDPESVEGLGRRLGYLLERGERAAWTVDQVRRALLAPETAVRDALHARAAAGKLTELAADEYILEDRLASLCDRWERRLQELSSGSNRLRVPQAEWKRGFDESPVLWERICRNLESAGRVRRVGDAVLPAGDLNMLPSGDRELAARILALYEQERYETTHPDELHAKLHVSEPQVSRLLDYLLARGDLVRIAPNVILERAHLKAAQDHVVETIRARGVLSSPAFKEHLGVSRKYAMAILDFLDLRKVTIRVQNDRRLLPGWEQRLV